MITTERNTFIGAHLTPEVKEAMREEARRQQISMSKLLYRFSVEKLKSLGYTIKEPKQA
jgi:hypothetical protein